MASGDTQKTSRMEENTKPNGAGVQEKHGPISATRTHFQSVLSQSMTTRDVLEHSYSGSGTAQDPFIIDWLPNDPKNGFNIPAPMRWWICCIMSAMTLSASFGSTVFSSSLPEIQIAFNVSSEVAILSVSLFVLGFAIGPMIWGPLSELYGRQNLFTSTFVLTTLFSGATVASPNVAALLVLRFLVGTFCSVALVNAAGVVADIFPAKERGLAIMVYSAAPFMGPTLGPLISGFIAQAGGWKWVDGMATIFFGVMLFLRVVFVPETYGPFILRRRARKMSRMSGKTYVSKSDVGLPPKQLGPELKKAMTRPWIMLVTEPITLAMAVYASIVYGILYLNFTAFPIIFEERRGWSQGISGLSYLGMLVGQLAAVFFYSFVLEIRYRAKMAASLAAKKRPSPEMRLEPAFYGAFLLPIGLFWFAWTSYDSIHWIVCILGSSLFGAGQVLLFIAITNYIIDVYTLFTATSSASNAILRALFGAAFPLFTPNMYENLGVQWASSIPAFLALVCSPIPFVLLRYGPMLRERSKFAKEARALLEIMLKKQAQAAKKEQGSENPPGVKTANGEAQPTSQEKVSSDGSKAKAQVSV